MKRKRTHKWLKTSICVNNKGFSLVEAVVAIAVIGIVSVAVSSLFFDVPGFKVFRTADEKKRGD